MEQDVKVGNVGEVVAQESLASESAEFTGKIGPLKASVKLEADNAEVVAYLAGKLSAGWMHDGLLAVAKDLGVAVPAAPAAPSA